MKRFIIIIVVLIAAYYGWHKWSADEKKNKENKKPPVLVSVAAAQQQDISTDVTNVGTVTPIQTVAVRSRIDSQIMEIKFKDGDYVKQGDLLFVLDDRTLKAQLVQFQANLVAAQSQLENLRQQYERNKQLIKSGFESQEDLDNSKAAYEAQVANVNAIQASIDSSKVQIEYTKITAPISGRTGTINSTLGNTVKANDTTSLVVINQVMPIRVQFSLPQIYIGQLRQAMTYGQGVIVTVTLPNGDKLTGKLEYIDNNIDSQTGTFVAKAIFDNNDEKLWPGMFVNLVINLGLEKNAITIPEVAVQHGQDYDFIFVINGDTTQKRKVTIERLQDNLAVIKDGLQAGEQVAVDGMLSLSDGAKISIVQEKDKQKNESGDSNNIPAN